MDRRRPLSGAAYPRHRLLSVFSFEDLPVEFHGVDCPGCVWVLIPQPRCSRPESANKARQQTRRVRLFCVHGFVCAGSLRLAGGKINPSIRHSVRMRIHLIIRSPVNSSPSDGAASKHSRSSARIAMFSRSSRSFSPSMRCSSAHVSITESGVPSDLRILQHARSVRCGWSLQPERTKRPNPPLQPTPMSVRLAISAGLSGD